MSKKEFYYVSLSDGDASLRVRFLFANTSNFIGSDTPCYILQFIISGSLRICGKTYFKGQCVLSSSSTNNHDYAPSADCFCIGAAFDGMHSDKLMEDLKLKQSNPPVSVSVYDIEELEKIYIELSDLYPDVESILTDPPQILSQITAKSYFYRMLHSLENQAEMQIETRTRKLLVAAEEYMRNNFNKSVTIDDTAKYLSIDRRSLYNLFIKHSGISPKQYLNNIKISRATDLLLNTDKNISEIAEIMGYKDPFQFSSFFKKQTGLSPKKFRSTL